MTSYHSNCATQTAQRMPASNSFHHIPSKSRHGIIYIYVFSIHLAHVNVHMLPSTCGFRFALFGLCTLSFANVWHPSVQKRTGFATNIFFPHSFVNRFQIFPPIVAAIACWKLHEGIIRERRIKRLLVWPEKHETPSRSSRPWHQKRVGNHMVKSCNIKTAASRVCWRWKTKIWTKWQSVVFFLKVGKQASHVHLTALPRPNPPTYNVTCNMSEQWCCRRSAPCKLNYKGICSFILHYPYN